MTGPQQEGTQAMRWRVTGRVQGVFFRASTQRLAQSLELVGYARNMPDRSVEVFAVGSAAALAELASWLNRGPPAAKVAQVDCVAIPVPETLPEKFVTG